MGQGMAMAIETGQEMAMAIEMGMTMTTGKGIGTEMVLVPGLGTELEADLVALAEKAEVLLQIPECKSIRVRAV